MPVNRFWKSTALGLPLALLLGAAAQAQSADPIRNVTPVTDEMLRDPPASDWLMWRRTRGRLSRVIQYISCDRTKSEACQLGHRCPMFLGRTPGTLNN